ncbi:class I SAM-dependent methyltransferase [Zavarzinella formosa]|uniref:class I SAM-dependent methyltransferase n=1 Tax=Zavarzinella formosa TaxID=360055 RepID=UPI0002D64E44|nr:methyltransferase domain-containing protein [Zavarzinella formosa]
MIPPKRKPQFVDLAWVGGSAGREDSQGGWQSFVGRTKTGHRILDMGAGLGLSRARLANGGANEVVLQDPSVEMAAVDIHTPIHEIGSDAFTLVTAFDVIEHIEEDWAWLANALRVASHSVILTTPNYHVSQAANPHHVREYTPAQLYWMASRIGTVLECRCGDPVGENISPALSPAAFFDSRSPHLYIEVARGREGLVFPAG